MVNVVINFCSLGRAKNLASVKFLALTLFMSLASMGSGAYAQVSFENVTSELGPFHTGESWGAAWADVNGDYYPDIGANNHRHRDSVWINQGGQKFVDGILQFDRSRAFTEDVEIDTHGTSFADINNDGNQDMVNAQSSRGGRPIVLLNTDDSIAIDSTRSLALPNLRAGRLASFYDFDRDGLLDFFYGSSISSQNRIYRNEGASFVNVTPATFGDDCGRLNYFQLADTDADASGFQNLDVLCIREGNFPAEVHDFSDGTIDFNDVTGNFPNTSNTIDTAFADFDNDGDTDVIAVRGAVRANGASLVNPTTIEGWFVSSPSAGSKSFTFQSSGSVTIRSLDIARDRTNIDRFRIGSNNNTITSLPFTLDKNDPFVQGISTGQGRGVYIGYDPATSTWTVRFLSPNRFEDYYLVLEGDGLTEPADFVVSTRDLPIAARMLKNNNGTYSADFSVGLNDASGCISVAAGDFDNDMDVDIYLACAAGVENTANQLYLNDGSGNFTLLSDHGGEGAIGAGLEQSVGLAESVVMADYDLDGRLDLFTTNGALFVPEFRGGPDELLRNTTVNSNNWIELDLVGTSVNRDGVGAKITATTGGVTQIREQNGGYHRWSQHHQRIHFGLGVNQTVDITIDWPDGTQDTFSGLAANSLYQATQGQSAESVVVVPGEFNAFPAPQAGDECSSNGQAFSPDLDTGVFLYRNCDTGTWVVSAVVGGSEERLSFSGTILSATPIIGTNEVDVEGADSVDVTDRRIDFSLNLLGTQVDIFEFDVGPDAACIQIDNDVPLFLGAGHLPAPNSLDLNQIGICDLNADGSLNVPVSSSTTVNVVTAPFTIPGSGGSSTQLVDLSASGAQIGDEVLVTNLVADGDLDRQNGSNEVFSLNFNGGEFQIGSLSTGQECVGTLQPVSTPINQTLTVVDIGNGVPGLEIFGLTTPQVSAQCNDVQYALTITVTTQVVVDPPVEPVDQTCGEPNISPTSDRAIHVWRDCADTGNWFVRATAGGGSALTYTGNFVTGGQFDLVSEFSFEGIDNVSLSGDSRQIDFEMRMANAGVDGFEYALTADSGLCLTLDDSSQSIRVGANGVSFPSPVNLVDLNASCATISRLSVGDVSVDEGVGSAEVVVSLSAASSEVVRVSYATADDSAIANQDYSPLTDVIEFQAGETTQSIFIPIIQDSDVEPLESFRVVLSNPVNAELLDSEALIDIVDDEVEVTACGKPDFDQLVDAGIFLWQDCGNTERWFVQATAGTSPVSLTYTGSITSDAPITSLEVFSFEGIDRAELINGDTQLDFIMRMASRRIDGFEFSVDPSAACLDLTSPSGSSVIVGQNNISLSPPFDIFTLGACQ